MRDHTHNPEQGQDHARSSSFSIKRTITITFVDTVGPTDRRDVDTNNDGVSSRGKGGKGASSSGMASELRFRQRLHDLRERFPHWSIEGRSVRLPNAATTATEDPNTAIATSTVTNHGVDADDAVGDFSGTHFAPIPPPPHRDKQGKGTDPPTVEDCAVRRHIDVSLGAFPVMDRLRCGYGIVVGAEAEGPSRGGGGKARRPCAGSKSCMGRSACGVESKTDGDEATIDADGGIAGEHRSTGHPMQGDHPTATTARVRRGHVVRIVAPPYAGRDGVVSEVKEHGARFCVALYDTNPTAHVPPWQLLGAPVRLAWPLEAQQRRSWWCAPEDVRVLATSVADFIALVEAEREGTAAMHAIERSRQQQQVRGEASDSMCDTASVVLVGAIRRRHSLRSRSPPSPHNTILHSHYEHNHDPHMSINRGGGCGSSPPPADRAAISHSTLQWSRHLETENAELRRALVAATRRADALEAEVAQIQRHAATMRCRHHQGGEAEPLSSLQQQFQQHHNKRQQQHQQDNQKDALIQALPVFKGLLQGDPFTATAHGSAHVQAVGLLHPHGAGNGHFRFGTDDSGSAASMLRMVTIPPPASEGVSVHACSLLGDSTPLTRQGPWHDGYAAGSGADGEQDYRAGGHRPYPHRSRSPSQARSSSSIAGLQPHLLHMRENSVMIGVEDISPIAAAAATNRRRRKSTSFVGFTDEGEGATIVDGCGQGDASVVRRAIFSSTNEATTGDQQGSGGRGSGQPSTPDTLQPARRAPISPPLLSVESDCLSSISQQSAISAAEHASSSAARALPAQNDPPPLNTNTQTSTVTLRAEGREERAAALDSHNSAAATTAQNHNPPSLQVRSPDKNHSHRDSDSSRHNSVRKGSCSSSSSMDDIPMMEDAPPAEDDGMVSAPPSPRGDFPNDTATTVTAQMQQPNSNAWF